MLNRKLFRSFTLVELFVVIAVLGILFSMIFPSFQRFQTLAEQMGCKNNMKNQAAAFSVYIDDNEGLYPYGVNTYQLTSNKFSTDSLSPQELIYDYLSLAEDVYVCPSDKSPEDYIWWRFRGHPNNITASSYMFCEIGLYGSVFSFYGGQPLSTRSLVNPSTYSYMTDGRFCPNGWRWNTLNPDNYDASQPWLYRIDWDHEQYVNVLYGDMHVGDKWQYDDINNMRRRPDRE